MDKIQAAQNQPIICGTTSWICFFFVSMSIFVGVLSVSSHSDSYPFNTVIRELRSEGISAFHRSFTDTLSETESMNISISVSNNDGPNILTNHWDQLKKARAKRRDSPPPPPSNNREVTHKRIRRNVKSRSEKPINVTNTTKLIIFLHFHKAGGSSVVNAAEMVQNLFDPNSNGNPKDRNKNKIPFWNYSELKLIDFFRRCLHSNHATFIATENNWFRSASVINEAFKRQNRIELVTQLRNPFSRFVSNYFFDLKFRNIKPPNMSLIEKLKWYHSCRKATGPAARCKFKFNATNDWNMYVRVLSSQFDRDRNVTEHDLEIAKKELNKFDLVTVLEMSDAAALWKAQYGMTMTHSNGNKKYDEIYAAERKKDKDFNDKFKKFEESFRRWNHFDYVLYEYAQELHRKFALQRSNFSQ